jgi:endonuclease/exonuclease/phosphatase family metal-dependent hydrolase
VRKSAGLNVSVSDIPELGVLHRDADGQVRSVRWGLVASVQAGGLTFTLLNVHLKSGCFHQRLAIPLPPPPASNDCDTLARQVPLLDNFVRSTQKPFLLIGDFNRNLDLEGDQVFARLTGRDTPGTADQTGLQRVPFHEPSICLPKPPSEHNYVPIDYLLLSDRLRGRDYREMSPQAPPGISASLFKKKFGDHCPKSLTVDVP